MDFVRLAIYNNTHHTPRHGQEAGARSGRGTAMRSGRDAGRWGDGERGAARARAAARSEANT